MTYSDPPSDGSAAADDFADIGEVVRFDVVGYGDRASVLHVVGEIDTLTAPLLRAQLDS